MAPKGSQRVVKTIVAENRKARFNYEIIDTYEAGLVLTGTEVKSLREGKANIAESYASDEGEELWLINSHLPEYLQANRFNHEPRRRRKLLLSKWTARQPQNREKHFLVSELICDEEGTVLQVELQAVLTQRSERLDWQALQDGERWQMGWK